MVAFFIRAYSGFGGALLSIPLLSLIYPLKSVVPVECFLEVFLSLILAPTVVQSVHKKSLYTILLGSIVGSFLGVMLLKLSPEEFIKQCLGAFTILGAIYLLTRRSIVSTRMPSYIGLLVGCVGGTFGGLFGVSGTLYVLYLSGQSLPKHVFRATLIVIFFAEYSLRLIFYINYSLYGWDELLLSISLIPSLLVATILGSKLHIKVNDDFFNYSVAVLLLLSGILFIL